MPAQIALSTSLVCILLGPQERKETVEDQSPVPKGLLMFNVCVGALLMLWTGCCKR